MGVDGKGSGTKVRRDGPGRSWSLDRCESVGGDASTKNGVARLPEGVDDVGDRDESRGRGGGLNPVDENRLSDRPNGRALAAL